MILPFGGSWEGTVQDEPEYLPVIHFSSIAFGRKAPKNLAAYQQAEGLSSLKQLQNRLTA